MELTEYEIKLMGWAIQTSRNALLLEQETDDPVVSEESSALLLRRLHKLETRLTDYYEQKVISDGESAESD